jgi:hypothetical protein
VNTSLLLPLSLVLTASTGVAFSPQETEPQEALWETAGEGVASGELKFSVTDESGAFIPCRLTFLPLGEDHVFPDIFAGIDAAQGQIGVRKNVIFSLSGHGRVTVPLGDYTVYVTRGFEWSRAEFALHVIEAGATSWSGSLVHELDTDGWVSGDFHLHTLTYSGHGDSNMPERLISLIAEGVEFAVATDHNHNTDYGPTITEIGAQDLVSAVVGNEVSTPIGHINAFPLDASRPIVDKSSRDANELFRMIRAEPNEHGVVPIVQLNHPRWDGIDYFAQTHFDPVTGTSSDPAFSLDFDSIEVMNESASWGYYEKFVEGVETASNRHSVLEDWYHLLDRGHRSIAVGNSDSHALQNNFAGYPRNLIYTGDDAAGSIEPSAVAAAIRSGRVVSTSGPMLKVSSGEQTQGDLISIDNGLVQLRIEVQAASWIDCDRVEIVVNGDTVQVIDLGERVGALREVHEVSLPLEHDSWIVVLAEGDTPLRGIVPPRLGREAYPLAIANPLRVDTDGDGEWTAPFVTAAQEAGDLFRARPGDYREGELRRVALGLLGSRGGAAGARLITASIEGELEQAALLTWAGTQARDRRVLLAAARGAEALGKAGFQGADSIFGTPLYAAMSYGQGDPYLDVAIARALLNVGDGSNAGELILELLERHGMAVLEPYMDELEPLIHGVPVREWMVLGLFAAPEQGTISTTLMGPEEGGDSGTTYLGRDGTQKEWTAFDAAEDGHVDLRELARGEEGSENCFAYAQTWLFAEEARSVLVGLGTDDGGRVFLNGALYHEDLDRQGASPLQHVKVMPLEAGWNRVLFQVENGGGSYGLYFHLFDADVPSKREL